MKLENMIKTWIFSAAMALSNNANATEAQVATPEQTGYVIVINENAHSASQENKQDWSQQKELLDSGKATVLIQPVQNVPGYCEVGLDGFSQKYDLPADKRTLDGKLEKSEMILNLAETNRDKKFYFPCDLEATPETVTTPNAILIEVPGPVIEDEVPPGKFSVGAGYVHLFTAGDRQYGFDGQLYGGKFLLIFQPRQTNWYFGGEITAVGNESSAEEKVEVPAADGPLAGQLVMKGTNQYSLFALGLGLGATGGYMVENDYHFGVGVELYSGIMLDVIGRELTENSTQYINGMAIEGTDISNTSSDLETNFNVYNGLGFRVKLDTLCLTPAFGARTNFSQIEPMYSVGISYCANKE